MFLSTLSVRICAPVITATTKYQLMKRMIMRVMTVLMNTVTNLILNTEPFPFLNLMLYFLCMIYGNDIFLFFLEFHVF